ncbi:MAG: glycosyltransferase [Desulforegulaceae bacterium]|nr:glycosyltransferase [Desulforegulaceae bacterium]
MTGKKADLHVHSCYSKRPSSWILQKIGCRESYTSPLDVYNSCKNKGMDFVTITDHNLIDGALEIAHLKDTFISEEITAYFPEDGCKIHVLAWNITEKDHLEISKLRENIYDLCTFLKSKNIAFGAAHPLYSINDRLNKDHFEKLILMFKNFEMNGTRDSHQNNVLGKILFSLTPQKIEMLENKHGFKAYFENPFIKQITGGSDDHSSLNIASKFTHISKAENLIEFIEALSNNPKPQKFIVKAQGIDSSPLTMAHNLYSIIYQFYKTKIPFEKFAKNDPLFSFMEEILTNTTLHYEKPGLIKNFFIRKKTGKSIGSKAGKFGSTILNEARKLVLDKSISSPATIEEKPEILFKTIENLSNTVLKKFADKSLDKLSKGYFFDIFQTIGSAASLYAMLSPYFIGYGLFTKDRQFCNLVEKLYLEKDNSTENQSIAYLTDTLDEINGVSKTLLKQLEISEKLNLSMEVINCSDKTGGLKNTKTFTPTGKFSLPSYEEIKLFYPPFLKILDYCYNKNFSHIHAVTPGPMGLCAIAVSKILKKPLYATYHTSFPQYVKALTNDDSLEELAWRYMVWFYNQADIVYVPSKAVEEELESKGVEKDKLVFYPRGTDTSKFSPEKKDIITDYKFNIPSNTKRLIYAGRISKEKNIDDLVKMFKKLCGKRTGIHLVIAGDGPYMETMKKELEGFPTTFTGFINTNDLASLYASSDIFIFPSTTDTFGNVVMEAQACGIPVIVTDKGGPKENLIPGKTGYIVKAHDINQFVSSALNLLDDEELLNQMKKNARKYMETRSFESCHKELFMLYKGLTPEKAA